jgi:hypothetical protein
MIENLAARLQAVDPAVLADVVRQDQRSPSFDIADWSFRRLSDKGIMNPDGLWLYSGDGRTDGIVKPWSVVVKVFERPEQEQPPDARSYWKRELLVAQSQLFERLPGPVRGPRYYRTDEYADSLWLWMEHVQELLAGAWTLDDYVFAARQLGRWNGACAAIPLPAEPWLNNQPHRGLYEFINPETAWQSPWHQMYISEETRLRWEHLWAEREMFDAVLQALPQCLAHFDCQRRNLLIQQDRNEQAELVAIDWAFCGVEALGAELHALVGTSTTLVEWPSANVLALDKAAFNSYVQGLHDAGWSGNADVVRLAQVACLGIYRGTLSPLWMNRFCSPEFRSYALQTFGIAEEELYLHLLPLLHYWLDCADEARVLMRKLGIALT